MIIRKCVLNGKWKADERFKAWIAAEPTSKTKAMCVVCNKAINISSMGEVAKPRDRQVRKLSFPSFTHFLSSIFHTLIAKTPKDFIKKVNC